MSKQIGRLATTNGEFLAQRPRYSQSVRQLRGYVETAVDWEATHGLLLRAPRAEGPKWQQVGLVPAPVALAPSPIPRHEFEKVVALQPVLNAMFDRVSRDHDFLMDTLQSMGGADEFTSRVFAMYLRQRELGVAKPATIGIHRSDYLIHAPEDEPGASPRAKQVEFNTIASSFASLSAIVGDFHRYMLARTGYAQLLEGGRVEAEQLPPNESLTSIADGIAAGFALYGSPDAVVAMVVQPGERNVLDQRWVERGLWERHRIRVVRLTFAEILDRGSVRDGDNRLFVDGAEIAVAYYRSGYAPTDFPTEREWEGRWLVERSRAVPVPSLAFVDGPETAQRVRECFVGLYPLDESEEGQRAYKMALETPENFVVKPQREGGGYNSYGSDIPALLGRLTPEERRGFILMDLIRASRFSNVLLRDGELVASEVVSELGIYGIWVSDERGAVAANRAGGHLLRTKVAGVMEGGVAAGFAVIDSPLLV
ncbi:Glutathione synthetase [Coemansia javaensis]|uniref:Glutathione synthetase n=1 Tax=Coemansia javaensis TaxID=2761396 RepID=A0A9W8LMA2_9FUNG|nr:Glutathione synthetase [Coemansia javaensis]